MKVISIPEKEHDIIGQWAECETCRAVLEVEVGDHILKKPYYLPYQTVQLIYIDCFRCGGDAIISKTLTIVGKWREKFPDVEFKIEGHIVFGYIVAMVKRPDGKIERIPYEKFNEEFGDKIEDDLVNLPPANYK